jgi:hydrogenase nickel incorporation protein HypA/HybF
MHEFSLCEGIVKGVEAELAKLDKPLRLKKTVIVVGCLHQIVPETLTFAYEVLTRETPLNGSFLEIKNEKATCECADCSWKGEVFPPVFKCGACGSGNVALVSGKELFIESLEVDVDE